MSNINNNGVDMNSNTLTQLNLSAVKELDDEVAATCSGGIYYKGSNDPDIIFYDLPDLDGASLNLNASIGDGDPNIGLRDKGGESGWNDRPRSVLVRRGNWILFEDAGFKGLSSKVLTPGPDSNVQFTSIGSSGITSALRVG